MRMTSSVDTLVVAIPFLRRTSAASGSSISTAMILTPSFSRTNVSRVPGFQPNAFRGLRHGDLFFVILYFTAPSVMARKKMPRNAAKTSSTGSMISTQAAAST